MEEIDTVDTVGPIVATADASEPVSAAVSALEQRVRELETAVQGLQTMRAQAEPSAVGGRKTIGAAQVSVLAKGAAAQPEGSSVDDALRSLSIEQRIAVKSGLMRAGLIR